MINNPNAMISLSNVSFAYPSNPVLQNITLVINKGDFVGIMGKNGSGKSTLLKLMLQQLKPQTGTIALQQNVHVGYVEQVTPNSDSSFPASVQEIVMLGLQQKIGLFKHANKKHKNMAINALNMVGLHGFEHKQFSFLSGGQQQRVIIAKALVSNPDLLILDEPTTGIDASSEAEFFALLDHLNKGHGKTIVLVTHNTSKLKGTNKVFVVQDKVIEEGVYDNV